MAILRQSHSRCAGMGRTHDHRGQRRFGGESGGGVPGRTLHPTFSPTIDVAIIIVELKRFYRFARRPWMLEIRHANQIAAKMITFGVVIAAKKQHLLVHGAGYNLSRHEKMPQIHQFGEFRLCNAGFSGRVVRALLCSIPLSQRSFNFR